MMMKFLFKYNQEVIIIYLCYNCYNKEMFDNNLVFIDNIKV